VHGEALPACLLGAVTLSSTDVHVACWWYSTDGCDRMSSSMPASYALPLLQQQIDSCCDRRAPWLAKPPVSRSCRAAATDLCLPLCVCTCMPLLAGSYFFEGKKALS
jgi:hypothetical protein